ncbi:MAG: glycine/sarcosine/betaine reductase selenoprotein B family protein [Acidimicrobiia bacterium]|nr:glycine/sarcosine/betaine reductase selenoprotein B family protein [Acidimicrobiia bacterium]
MTERFEEFRSSFSYGSRSDMSFKFLAAVDDDTAAEMVRRILEEAGALLDTGDPRPLIDVVIDAQARAYLAAGLPERYHYSDAPFARPRRPVAESRLALLSSSGHHVEDPEPFGVRGMTQAEAEDRIDEFLKAAPTLEEIPVDVSPDDLEVRHGGYDVRGVRADHNVAFPIDRLRELEAEGIVGELHATAFSFVGAASQLRMAREVAPAWAERLRDLEIDVALLVPV